MPKMITRAFLAFVCIASISIAMAMSAAPSEPLQVVTSSGAVHDFTVELAIKPKEHAKGLMYRESMEKDAGMLFISPDEKIQTFWMKNTLIPLDMIFINKNGVIKHIHHEAIPHDTTPISSVFPAMGVLEINGGLAYELGISIGDTVKHKLFLAD